ncbi:Sulfite reductase [NADPH] subunit beta, partial [Coemansia guatemalensis]
MASTLRKTALHASTLTAAVAYTTATALDSTTVVVDDVQTSSAAELIGDSARLVRVSQATEVASVVSDSTDGKAVSIVVASSALIKLIPVLRDLAQRKRAVVLHVAASSAEDVSNVLAVRDSGCAVLRSSSPQQAIDFAVVATLAAQKLGVPFIHCFNEAMSPVDVQTYEPVAVQAGFAEFLEKAQEEEAAAQSQGEATHAAVAEAMELFDSGYLPVAYVGAADASVVYVTFGAELGAEAAGAAGVVQVSLFRPLSAAAIVEKLPATVNRLVAFEQVTRQPTAWGPLLFDLAAVLHSSEWEAQGGGKQPILLDAVSAESPAAFAAAQVAKVTAHAAGLESPAHFNPAELVGIAERSDEEAPRGSSQGQHGLSQEQQQKRVEQIPYGQLLRDMFKERLNVANAAESRTIWGDAGQAASTPEFGFG